MTVSTTTSRVSYSGNGLTDEFSVPFLFLDNSHLVVILVVDSTGVETTQTITTHYTVTGAGNDAGGTLTMVTAPTSGETLVILRDTTIDQETDYQANDTFPAETHETALDKLTLISQELDTELSRTLKLSEGDTSTDLSLPTPVASQLLGWDGDADALQNYSQAVLDATLVPTLVADQVVGVNSGATAFEFKFTMPSPTARGLWRWNDAGDDLDTSLAIPTASANQLLGWNSTGTALENKTASSTAILEGIINGDCMVAQESTSTATAASGTYIVDKFQYKKTGTMVHTVSQSTDVPTFAQAGVVLKNSIKVDCTTADTTLGASDFCIVEYNMTGFDTIPFSQQEVTIHIWHKHTKTGTYSAAVQRGAGGDSYPFEYTQSVADTWELHTETLTLDPATDFATDETAGLGIVFSLGHGTDFDGTADAWVAADKFGTSNQVNACDNVANNFLLTGITMRLGSDTSTVTERPTFYETLKKCQIDYNKSYDYDVAPATADANGALGAFTENAGDCLHDYTLPCEMRTNPTITFFNSANGTSGGMDEVDGGTDLTSQSATSVGRSRFQFSRIGGASNQRYRFHYVADARF